MAVSTFSRRQRATAVAGAVLFAALSWAYFAEVWRGVVVTGAGDVSANGYYKWEPTYKKYLKSGNAPASAWRLPNVYDLVSQAPEFRKDDKGSVYFLSPTDNDRKRSRVWYLMRSGSREYSSDGGDDGDGDGGGALSVYSNTPPSTGWVSLPDEKHHRASAGVDPPPQVQVCGKSVPPEPLPEGRRDKGGSYHALKLAEGPAEVLSHPGTMLVLLINLACAYHLWANRVSPDSVAISYALFWEDREYWRLFTASFSHFEPLHLVFNAMGIWNTRSLEPLLGTFRYLYLSLNLVVTTIMLVMLIKHALVRWRGMENHRESKAVGFSCVLFAYMTYLAVAMREFCPLGPSFPNLCFATWSLPTFGGLPSVPVNLGPFASLLLAQVVMPRAAFLGHLAGIFMGYLMAWGLLGGLSTPVLAGISVMFLLQHSEGWARKMPDFSLLLQGWAAGDAGRVARARTLSYVLGAHVCLTVAFLCLFTWGTGLAEIMALVVGYNAVQALKCCCCPDSVPAEHRFCVNLLKAYGALSVFLLASDLLSFGAMLGQACFVAYSGVSGISREGGLGLLAIAAAVHGAAIAGCVEGVVIFRDGQTFLSSVGLGHVVTAYSVNASAAGSSTSTSTAPSTSYASAAGITSGRLYRGGGRALGTVASNRAPSSTGRAGPTRTHPGFVERGRVGSEREAGLPLIGRAVGERSANTPR